MTAYFTHDDINLRPVEWDDVGWIRALRNDGTTWPRLTDPRPTMEGDQDRWYRSLSRDGRFYFVASDKKTTVGLVRMDEYDPVNRSIRTGLDVIPKFRRKGYGYRIYSAIKRYCFCELGLHRVWLQVLDDNATAIHLYSRHKFVLEGRMRGAVYRHGKFRDYLIMSILESEYREAP